MKRLLLLAPYLLCSIVYMPHGAAEVINAPLLATIDPIFNRLHPEFNISHIIYFDDLVQRFLNETFTHTSQKQVSLTTMVELERALPDKKKLRKFTERCVHNLVQAVQQERLLELFSLLQEQYRALVLAWSDQFHRHTSPFVKFSLSWRTLGSELTVMQKTVTSLEEYQQFLSDLHRFLNDLVVSLPHAYAEYQECAKTNNQPTFR